MTGPSIQLLTTEAELEALRDEWTALVGRTPGATVYQTWLANMAAWRMSARDRELHLLAARSPSGDLVGLLPLSLLQTPRGPLCHRLLEPLGRRYLDHTSLLVDYHREEEVLRGFHDWLDRHNSNWDRLNMPQVRESVRSFQVAGGSSAKLGGTVHWAQTTFTWKRRFSSGDESPLDGASGSWRRTVRRKTRLALGDWGAALEGPRPTHPEDGERFADLHVLRRGTRSAFLDPLARAALAWFLDEAGRSGVGKVVWLTHSGRDYAALITLQHGTEHYAWRTAYDPAAPRGQSPGLLLFYVSAQDALDHGATGFDLSFGEEDFKKHLANHSEPVFALEVVSSSPHRWAADLFPKLSRVPLLRPMWSALKRVRNPRGNIDG